MPLIIDLIKSSESKYQNQDYKGAIDATRKIREIIFQNSHLLGLESRFRSMVRELKGSRKYDLIQDYKKRIDELKKSEIIRKLEELSESKYFSGDYKGSIVAMRRSEKYY